MPDLSQKLRNLWDRCSWPRLKGVSILTLRGCKVVDGDLKIIPERKNLYDDTMFLLDESLGIRWHAPCTGGQPGSYWITKYGQGEGAPFTRPCCVKYVRGQHRGMYDALRQSTDGGGLLPVIRDINKNGDPEYAPESPDSFDYARNTGINIHASGGRKSTVDWASSGCHVVQSPWNEKPWTSFIEFTYTRYRDQESFWYGVAPATWTEDTTKRLLWGSTGPSVDRLVEFLRSKNLAASTDYGMFRESLDEGYRAWQRQQGRTQSGICENPPW